MSSPTVQTGDQVVVGANPGHPRGLPAELDAGGKSWGEAIALARQRLGGEVHRTPVMRCRTFDRWTGNSLYFKCENLQRVGAFKLRGALNAVSNLSPEELARGVATHSSGNHAQALALAAKLLGTKAHIAMPRTAPAVKQAAVRGYGAEVTLCEPTLAAREDTVANIVARTGATFVHPYNDPCIVAGQATATVELLEEVPDLDLIVAPVGGGGLLAGTSIAARLHPRQGAAVRVVGAEPTGADDAARSLASGVLQPSIEPRTIADGLLTSLGELNFQILQHLVEGIVTVSDEQIIDAMRRLWERAKLVVEPSAAVPVAALLSGSMQIEGLRVGVILSGGNVDLESLPWLS